VTYVQHNDPDRAAMLKAAGVKSVAELFESIPEKVRLNRPLDLPPAMNELELTAHMQQLAARNITPESHVSFLGGGGYNHFYPCIVDSLQSRGEYLTAYTPYQAEASQGTLQHIFEYQTMMCELMGMELSNASHYDGSTALAEAVVMALDSHDPPRKRVAVSSAVNPMYREVLRTYFRHQGIEFVELATFEGATVPGSVKTVSGAVAGVVVQSPNYFGVIEDLDAIGEAAHAGGAVAIASSSPLASGVLKPPGQAGMDIAVGDAQCFGVPPQFGGPWVGVLTARGKFIRQIPGRIVGQTVDRDGKRAFCLTLQTREQHIRREKATSNICTSTSLMALRSTIALAALGPDGVRRMATLCAQRAHRLCDRLLAINGVKRPHLKSPFFNEFVVQTSLDTAELNRRLLKRGFIGGLDMHRNYPDLRHGVLLCATERHSNDDVDRFAAAVADALKE
jgi:glycine dehydrogenase subunit 1